MLHDSLLIKNIYGVFWLKNSLLVMFSEKSGWVTRLHKNVNESLSKFA